MTNDNTTKTKKIVDKHPKMHFTIIHYSDTKKKFITRSASNKIEITVKNDPLNTKAWTRKGEVKILQDSSKKTRFNDTADFFS